MSEYKGSVVRLYEGFHFKLTDEQVAAIAPQFAELAEANDAGHETSILAQVWETEEGVFACCYTVPVERVALIKEVLNRRDILAVKVDEGGQS